MRPPGGRSARVASGPMRAGTGIRLAEKVVGETERPGPPAHRRRLLDDRLEAGDADQPAVRPDGSGSISQIPASGVSAFASMAPSATSAARHPSASSRSFWPPRPGSATPRRKDRAGTVSRPGCRSRPIHRDSPAGRGARVGHRLPVAAVRRSGRVPSASSRALTQPHRVGQHDLGTGYGRTGVADVGDVTDPGEAVVVVPACFRPFRQAVVAAATEAPPPGSVIPRSTAMDWRTSRGAGMSTQRGTASFQAARVRCHSRSGSGGGGSSREAGCSSRTRSIVDPATRRSSMSRTRSAARARSTAPLSRAVSSPRRAATHRYRATPGATGAPAVVGCQPLMCIRGSNRS